MSGWILLLVAIAITWCCFKGCVYVTHMIQEKQSLWNNHFGTITLERLYKDRITNFLPEASNIEITLCNSYYVRFAIFDTYTKKTYKNTVKICKTFI